MSPARARTSQTDIVAAGRELLEAGGLDAVTMQAIADRVGIRAPSLYKRFSGRGDLIAAVGEYERQMRDYGYAAVAASQAAEAETGARHNRLMFWLYRRMTGARA